MGEDAGNVLNVSHTYGRNPLSFRLLNECATKLSRPIPATLRQRLSFISITSISMLSDFLISERSERTFILKPNSFANPLPDPRGRTPSILSVPTSSDATECTVPSPPAAINIFVVVEVIPYEAARYLLFLMICKRKVHFSAAPVPLIQ